MCTGIFFYYQQSERLKDFPGALSGILEKEEVFFYDGYYPSKPESHFDLTPLPPEALSRVHTPEMIERSRRPANMREPFFPLREPIPLPSEFIQMRLPTPLCLQAMETTMREGITSMAGAICRRQRKTAGCRISPLGGLQ